MEVHLVHFNAKYSNFKTALKHKDGLLVVAFFIDALGHDENKNFSKTSDHIQNIKKLHSKDKIESGYFTEKTIDRIEKKNSFVDFRLLVMDSV